jgi:peptide/nickel transport system permease protein
MTRFVLHRILLAIPTLCLVAVSVFFLIRLIPGDPAQIMAGDLAKPHQVEHLRELLGLNKPLLTQFLIWCGNMATGEWGTSIATGLPVLPLVLERLQLSAIIAVTTVIFAAAIAVPAGLLAAWRQGSRGDFAMIGISTLLLSIPNFWLGLLMLLVFGLKLGWLPFVGYVPFSENFGAATLYLVMPVLTLGLIELGFIARMARASSIEVLRLEFVTHARAKGLPERAVLWRHVLPNAFAPTWTVLGLILGNLLGGAAVTETVFTLPGLGRLLVDSIYARDYPVVQGCMLLIAGLYILINLLTDLLYPLFDPRVTA